MVCFAFAHITGNSWSNLLLVLNVVVREAVVFRFQVIRRRGAFLLAKLLRQLSRALIVLVNGCIQISIALTTCVQL